MKKLILSAAAVALMSAHSFAQSTWTLDKSHTKLGFEVNHMVMTEVLGDFKKYDVTLVAKDETFEDATVNVTIETASITTDEPKRDAHLQKEDMFNAAKYPTITFKSSSFKKVADKKYQVKGDLTIKGITKPVVLDVTLKGVADHPYAKKRFSGFRFTTTIKRADFNIGEGTPAMVIGEDVVISGSMEFFKN